MNLELLLPALKPYELTSLGLCQGSDVRRPNLELLRGLHPRRVELLRCQN